MRRVKKLLLVGLVGLLIAYNFFEKNIQRFKIIPSWGRDGYVSVFMYGDNIFSGEFKGGGVYTSLHCIKDVDIRNDAAVFCDRHFFKCRKTYYELPDPKDIVRIFTYTTPFYEVDTSILHCLRRGIPRGDLKGNDCFSPLYADFIYVIDPQKFLIGIPVDVTGDDLIVPIPDGLNYVGSGDSGMPVYALMSDGGVITIGNISSIYSVPTGRVAFRGAETILRLLLGGANRGQIHIYGNVYPEKYYQLVFANY